MSSSSACFAHQAIVHNVCLDSDETETLLELPGIQVHFPILVKINATGSIHNSSLKCSKYSLVVSHPSN